MVTRYILFFLCFLSAIPSFAQDDELFGPGLSHKSRKGFIIAANGSFDVPAGDMAKRFGSSYRIGPGVLYKTDKNWLFGAKFDFILGNKIKEDSLMLNIRDRYSTKGGGLYEFINNNGQRIGVPVYERGYVTGLSAGKIISFSKKHPDDGLMLLTTAGFMQHKLDIYDKDKSVTQLLGQYIKGYDRLTNGSFVEQYVGYVFFSDSRLINFTLGVDVLFGFTQGRRDYLYDVMRADTKQRTDILYGLRASWYIPLFRLKSEDISFE